MTVLVLYAVVPAGARIPAQVNGARGEAVALNRLDLGSVGVLYEQRDRPPSAEHEDLVSFGEVVQELASTSPVLPVRFGTTLPDLAGLEQVMRERGPGWRRRLAAVQGHVEVVVHVRDAGRPEASTSEDVTGTEYLLSRAAVLRHDAELVESVSAAIAPVVSEIRTLDGDHESRLACLVASEQVEALREALRRWAAAAEGRSTETTGPWPPFSFTEPEPGR